MAQKPPPGVTHFLQSAPRAAEPEMREETDAEYLARLDREIAAGLADLEAGNVVTAAENEAAMDRLMAELRAEASKEPSGRG